jgi:hypothetical protein
MKALNVHGGGAVFDRTSCKVGRRGQYGPEGIDRLRGLEGRKSPDDMKPSSSASQSERTDEPRGDVSLDDVYRYNDGGFRCFDCFDLRIALRRYFMGNGDRASFLPPQTNYYNSSGHSQFPKLYLGNRFLCKSVVIVQCLNSIVPKAFVERSANCTEESSKRGSRVCLRRIHLQTAPLEACRSKESCNVVVCRYPFRTER